MNDRSDDVMFWHPLPDIGMDEYLRPSVCTSPEHYLIIAILEDAIQTAYSDDANLRREAVKWIRGKGKRVDPDYIFTFDNCCEAVGLNPGKARAKILNGGYHGDPNHSVNRTGDPGGAGLLGDNRISVRSAAA